MQVEVGTDRWMGSKFALQCLMMKITRTQFLADPEYKAVYDSKSDDWKEGYNTAMSNAENDGLIEK